MSTSSDDGLPAPPQGKERAERYWESHLDRAYRAFEASVVREDLARYARLTE
jgi:hypothetical protein